MGVELCEHNNQDTGKELGKGVQLVARDQGSAQDDNNDGNECTNNRARDRAAAGIPEFGLRLVSVHRIDVDSRRGRWPASPVQSVSSPGP